ASFGSVSALVPGLIITFMMAAAAHFVSSKLGGPVMLYALLFGMSLNFLSEDEKCLPGIMLASSSVLRIGVALLGLQITWAEVASLGFSTILLVVSAVALTLIVGVGIARLLKLNMAYSFLSAGAVAICGASAALAISSVMPVGNNDKAKEKELENNTILAVVGVTALSTLAMVLYPLVIETLHMDHATAGIFLGATIHDVAQVIGAGYMISDETGQIAAIVKLLRVACLVPAVMIIGLLFRKQRAGNENSSKRIPLVPLFLVGFIVCVALNSAAIIPAGVNSLFADTSRWFLIAAVAALGMKTAPKKFFSIGYSPILALVLQTIFLAVFILGITML
ncbi:MAG: putative sulfate exporter family transporter, partial [Kordiimonadaceae bacterium]|nr:putative sulfate exporter family transporter [Kordiimonadaceae bacterium]